MVLIQLVGTLLFMIWIPVAAFQSVDRRMEEAARDVGAGPFRVFWSITLPQAGPVSYTHLDVYKRQELREKYADVIPATIPVFPGGEWEKAINDGWYREVAPNVDRAA